MNRRQRLYRILFPPYRRRSLLLRRWLRAPFDERAAAPATRPADAPRSGTTAKRVLLVAHEAPGGVRETTFDLAAALGPGWEAWLLEADPHRLTLRPARRGAPIAARWWLTEPWRQTTRWSRLHRRVYAEALRRVRPDVVHVRHLLGHTFDLLTAAREHGAPCLLSVHDFYLASPSYRLCDESGAHPSGSAGWTAGRWEVPLDWLGDRPAIDRATIEQWRREVAAVLPLVDALVTTSRHARDLLLSLYPQLAGRLTIIPHGREPLPRLPSVPLGPGEPLRLLALGKLDRAKGSELLAAILALDRRQGRILELHVLGEAPGELARLATVHGRYGREELPARVAALRPHAAIVASVWPETYSHTLSEAWLLGLPAFVTDIGALGERMREGGAGWLLPVADAGEAYRRIAAVAASPATLAAEQDRAGAVSLPTTHQMAERYRELYAELRGADKRPEGTKALEPSAAALVEHR